MEAGRVLTIENWFGSPEYTQQVWSSYPGGRWFESSPRYLEAPLRVPFSFE